MTNLLTTPRRAKAARRRSGADEWFARSPMRSSPDRSRSMGRAAPMVAALLIACAVGAVAEYFLDRDQGARRRHLLRDRTRRAARRRSREASRRTSPAAIDRIHASRGSSGIAQRRPRSRVS